MDVRVGGIMKQKWLWYSIVGFGVMGLGLISIGINRSDNVKVRSDVPAKTVLAESSPSPIISASAKAEPINKELMDRIQLEAEKRKIAPIDARVDKVWKMIPGYNGLEVDIDQTYRHATQNGGPDLTYFMKEVTPNVSIDDLGANPIYKGNSKKQMISFMINVAWGNEYLIKMLEELKKENVKTTFFFDGSWLNKNLELARAIGEAGHELSNHAYSHPNMSTLSRERQVDEIQKTEELLKKLGVKNKLFAPPSGDFNDQTVKIAHELGLKTVMWTIDTVDWQNPGADVVLRRITSRIEPGALVLMHPTESTSQALGAMIREVKKRGLLLGTVSEVLSSERIEPTKGE